MDVVTYISAALPSSAAQPGMVPLSIPGAGIPTGRAYERCPATRDTNDASFDFIAHDGTAAQTPGAQCDGKTALSISQAAPATVAVSGRIDYTLTYANSGASATDVYITDTLPLSTSYVAGSQVSAPAFGSSPVVFTDLGGGKLQWKLPLVGTGSGTISFSAQVAGSVPPGQMLANAVAQIGGTIVYTLAIDNAGGGTAGSIQVVDTLPEGLAYKTGSSNAAAGEPVVSGDGRTLTWNLPAGFTIGTGVTRSFQFTAIVNAAALGASLVNTAVVHGASDTNAQNDSASSDPTTISAEKIYLALLAR